MIIHERRDDAVSPVIGVMLLLVVTVVIAAVVVTFGTGLAGDSTATTPMALYEADNMMMEGNLLKTFDLVHKGGDKMELENLQVTIEPIGKEAYGGIVLIRPASYYNQVPDFMASPDILSQLIENDKLIKGWEPLTVPGKTKTGVYLYVQADGSVKTEDGKDRDTISISTGDRIRVSVQNDGLWIDFEGEDYMLPGTDDGSFDDIDSDSLVKWTLSDTRTNGVIAKGEFIVP